MPKRLRNPLPALALIAIVLGCAASESLRVEQTPDRPEAVPDLPEPMTNRPPFRTISRPTLGDRAVSFALEAVGIPYSWGGSSPDDGFDCSGLVRWAYGRVGVELPHSSYALHDLGRQVARSQVQPGDVLFFSGLGHVGLYVGGGRMVHAPQSGRRVEVVELAGSYYGDGLVRAKRMIPT